MSNLIIVESPNKIKKIGSFLDSTYQISASVGHIRILDGKDILNFGFDIENNFKPWYKDEPEKIKTITQLKSLCQNCSTIWLATDDDREGEGIAWHLKERLGLREDQYYRIKFREITKSAILDAISKPSKINYDVFNSYQARSILDRMIGYTLSPELQYYFKKYTLSAGRVQSVALKMVVEKEKEIDNFENQGFYATNAIFKKPKSNNKLQLPASLNYNFEIDEEKDLKDLLNLLPNTKFVIEDISTKQNKRNPPAPLITSTLQQEASSKLHFSPKKTMEIAQKLYEGGYITYMRTDSQSLSDEIKKKIKAKVMDDFGEEYHQSRVYKNKKGAQEAHEAIRPSKIDLMRPPIDKTIEKDHQKLYELIWRRTVASQMKSADVEAKVLTVGIEGRSEKFIIRAQKILFDGYLKLYATINNKNDNNDDNNDNNDNLNEGENQEDSDEDSNKKSNNKKTNKNKTNKDTNIELGKLLEENSGNLIEDKDRDDTNQTSEISDKELVDLIYSFKNGDVLDFISAISKQKSTQPPKRYTEASLVKDLEKEKIGRPSTYATIISTITNKKNQYVIKGNIKGKEINVNKFTISQKEPKIIEEKEKYKIGSENDKLIPSTVGKEIVKYLEEHYSDIMKYKFTANIEELLDQVAEGKYQWTDVIKTYYQILKPMIDKLVIQKKTGIKPISENSEGSEIEREIGTDPKTGAKIIEKMTRYGLRLILKLSEIDKSQKDKYVKITQEEVSDISLEKASELFKYPINFGKKNGKDLILDNGDYGFYLKFDEKSYNLKSYMEKLGLTESDIINWNLEQALKVKDAIETEKKSNVFKQLDNHISINKGKDNYYIMYKWGKSVCFASIPNGKTHMDITLEEAKEAIDKKKNGAKKKDNTKKDDSKKDNTKKDDNKKDDNKKKKETVKDTNNKKPRVKKNVK